MLLFQEGENNEKFDSHPRELKTLPAYLLVHNEWYYGFDLVTSFVLLVLAVVEDPAVPAFRVCLKVYFKLQFVGLHKT